MSTANNFKSDLFSLFGIWANSPVTHPKEIVIETLRDFFSQDSYYHYVKDEWGFAKTIDHTDLPNDAGIDNDAVTRLYIGENYRFDVKFYPAIFVKSSGVKSVPISFSRNKGFVKWATTTYVDGYGNETYISTPSYFERAGAYEGTLTLDIEAESTRTRDELCDLCSILFIDLKFEELVSAGVVVKNVSVTGNSDSPNRNDLILKASINLDVRMEWSQRTYITNIIEAINICCDIGNLSVEPAELSPNLTINTTVDFVNTISGL